MKINFIINIHSGCKYLILDVESVFFFVELPFWQNNNSRRSQNKDEEEEEAFLYYPNHSVHNLSTDDDDDEDENGIKLNTQPLEKPSFTDINECFLRGGHGPCQDVCTNTDGGYLCSCENLKGTKLSKDGHSCKELDACLVENGGCSHTCTNSPTGNILQNIDLIKFLT
jgi:hypothetical protein